jgi:hypothetical protein
MHPSKPDSLVTPILFNIDSDPTKNLWKEFVTLSLPTAKLKIEEKQFMKTVFYAAVNKGQTKTVKHIVAHLKRTATINDVQRQAYENFAKRFLKLPITAEMHIVSDFWDDLKGEIFVPTRDGVIQRLYTEKDLKQKGMQLLTGVKTSKQQVDYTIANLRWFSCS